MGKWPDFNVGFLLYIEKERIVLECHSWSEKNPPSDIRNLNLEIWLVE